MIPDDRTEGLEPPDCNRVDDDDDWFCGQCGSLIRDDATTYCIDCESERDEVNGIATNGTAETATLTVPKLATLDGKPTCALNIHHDHLVCPLLNTISMGRIFKCGWTLGEIHADNPDGSGYLRPCQNCPVHKTP